MRSRVEIRLVSKEGLPDATDVDPQTLRAEAARLDEKFPYSAPHRIETRRVISGDWGPVEKTGHLCAFKTPALLMALGAAVASDWADFDGRTLQEQLNEIEYILQRELRGDDVTGLIEGFYEDNYICEKHMSWRKYCDCGDGDG